MQCKTLAINWHWPSRIETGSNKQMKNQWLIYIFRLVAGVLHDLAKTAGTDRFGIL